MRNFPTRAGGAALVLLAPGAALGAVPYACAGFAQLGGAQLLCSHTDPTAPSQICTYSWTLAGTGGAASVVQGTFMLTPGQQNVTVYQGSGYANALATPVVLCQGRKTGP
jgi:hypothetical protein